jgi:hypothetical protein
MSSSVVLDSVLANDFYKPTYFGTSLPYEKVVNRDELISSSQLANLATTTSCNHTMYGFGALKSS